MPKFSNFSEQNLQQVHDKLVRIAHAAIQVIDCQVTDGVRTLQEQKKNVEKGVSKTMDSKHLPQDDGVSHAIDIMPYPIDWKKIEKGLNALKAADPTLALARVYYFQGIIKGLAFAQGISIRQGIDWDNDTELGDQSFFDLPHVELRG